MRTTVGLTGGIGAGKSTVAEMLADLGAVVIDADVLAREVVAPGTLGLAAVVERFGPDVLNEDGSLDRGGLADLVFSDAEALADLNAIVHPRVRARSAELAAQAAPDAVVVMMIPLLVETGLGADLDAIVVVDVPDQVQLDRVQARDGLSEKQVLARIRAQADRERRLSAATHVIDNRGSVADTRRQVEQLWRELQGEVHSSKSSRNQASS